MDKDRWEEIGSLFSRAIDLEPEEQAAFLDQRCGDDADLRHELESLLAAYGHLDESFLETLDVHSKAFLKEAEDAPERIGPWRVREEIGRGGMGVVYAAHRDDGQFDQRVALKLIKRGMDSDQILRRFLRERQILAGMDHPGIARLLDGGITPQGRSWLALEYIDGVPLTRYCDEQHLDVEQRLTLFAEVCDAVEYAHRNLVVHRDLKPSNILVDRAGRVRLLDFGIATLLSTDDDGDAATDRTEAERRVMTPGYGAPELVLGGPITTATDVFSLGVILYELLAGQLPFRFTDGGGTPLLAARESEPPKLSTLAMDPEPSGVARGIPRRLVRELDTIAAKAIRIDADRRYASAAALRDDIERYLVGEPVLACPDSLSYRLGKLVRRHRTSVVAAGLVALSLVTGLGAAVWQASIAADERDLARREAAQTQEVKDFIIDLFRATDPREAPGEALTADRLLDRGLDRVRGGLDDRPDLRLELLTAIAQASKLLGDYEKAETVFLEALAIDIGSDPRDQLRVAAALNGLGENYAFRENDAKAIEQHRRALAIRLAFDSPDSLDTAQSYNNLAVALAGAQELPEAISMYGHALRIQEKVRGEHHPETLNTLGNLGFAHRLQGDYAEAETLLRSVIDRMLDDQQDDHPYMVWYQSQLASVTRRLGDYVEAERLLRRALDLARTIWGESHPTTRDMMNNYAMIAHALGNDAEAAELMRRNMVSNLEQYGEQHPYVPLNQGSLGAMLLELGQIEEALRLFEAGEALHLEVSPPRYLVTHDVKHARARLAAGQAEHARRLIDRALATERGQKAPSQDRLMRSLTEAGSVYGALGELQEAAAHYQEALRLHDELGTSDHPVAGVAHHGLAKLHMAQGRLAEADDALGRVERIWSRTLPESHWRHAELLVTRGEYRIRTGDRRAGLQLIERGVAQLVELRGAAHWRVLAAIGRRDASTADRVQVEAPR